MNYFSYQPKGVTGRVWGLFASLANVSEEEKLGKDNSNFAGYAHTLEIVNAALNGTLATDLDSIDNFNLKAYEYICNQNDEIGRSKDVEKMLFIVDSIDEETEKVGYGDISERKLKTVDTAFDEVMDLDSFETNLNKLYNIRKTYITTKGIDLVSILYNSLKGIPEAMSAFREVISENLDLKELITSLCEDGSGGILMERLELAL